MRARSAWVRDLAPGVPYIRRDGDRHVIELDDTQLNHLALPWLHQIRYELRLRRLRKGGGKPVGSHDAEAPRAAIRPRRAPSPMKAIASAARTTLNVAGHGIKALPRLALTATWAILAVAGLTRFVQVNEVDLGKAIHFTLPHFVTRWHVLETAKSGQADADSFAAPLAPQSAAKPLPESNSSVPAPATQAQSANWLPMPHGPLPLNMVPYGSREPALPRGSSMFTEGESGGSAQPGSSSVSLLAASPEHAARINQRRVVSADRHAARIAPASLDGAASVERARAPQDGPEDPPVDAGVNEATRQTPAIDVRLWRPHPTVATTPMHTQAKSDTGPSSTDQASINQSAESRDAQPLKVNAPGVDARAAPVHPSFSVVTHTDDSLVVMEHGTMQQIFVGHTLPDGSKLLRVDHSGGGFTTTRGYFVAF